jgi:hypothetical protein
MDYGVKVSLSIVAFRCMDISQVNSLGKVRLEKCTFLRTSIFPDDPPSIFAISFRTARKNMTCVTGRKTSLWREKGKWILMHDQ